MVTTTMGMLHRVHRNTADLWPAVTLGLILMECFASSQQRLLCSATTSNLANHATACRRNDLAGSRRQFHTRKPRVQVMGHNQSEITRRTGQSATVTLLCLQVANNCTLGELADRLDVANGQLCLLASIQNLHVTTSVTLTSSHGCKPEAQTQHMLPPINCYIRVRSQKPFLPQLQD